MPKFLWEIKQNSADWFAARIGIITASEMHRIITPGGKKAKAETTENYMNRLLFEYVSGLPFQENDYQSDYMQMGHDNEEAAAERFEFHTGLKPELIGLVTNDEGTIGASPDRIIRDLGTVEVKSPIGPTQIGYLLDKQTLVEKYRVQVQCQIWVCDFDQAFIDADNPKLPPVILNVGRDQPYIDVMAEYTKAFNDRMMERRLRLEREFGPFVRPKVREDDNPFGEFGVSMDDVEAIIAARGQP